MLKYEKKNMWVILQRDAQVCIKEAQVGTKDVFILKYQQEHLKGSKKANQQLASTYLSMQYLLAIEWNKVATKREGTNRNNLRELNRITQKLWPY